MGKSDGTAGDVAKPVDDDGGKCPAVGGDGEKTLAGDGVQQLVAGADGGGCARPVDDDCGEGPVAGDGVAAPVACVPLVDDVLHAGTGLCPLTITRRLLRDVERICGDADGHPEDMVERNSLGFTTGVKLLPGSELPLVRPTGKPRDKPVADNNGGANIA